MTEETDDCRSGYLFSPKGRGFSQNRSCAISRIRIRNASYIAVHEDIIKIDQSSPTLSTECCIVCGVCLTERTRSQGFHTPFMARAE